MKARSHRRVPVAALACATLLGGVAEASAQDALPDAPEAAWYRPTACPSAPALRRELDQLRERGGIPGVAVAALADGKVVFSEGLGHTDLSRRVRVTDDTPFRLASVTKPIVGLALMRAVEQGKVSLDDVARVANPTLPDARITLAHLASHRSGIRDDDDGAAFYLCGYHAADGRSYLDEALQGHCPQPPITRLAPFLDAYLTPGGALYDASHWASGPQAVPGATYAYSNVGVALLGRELEQRLGRSLQGYVAEQLLRPLGLRATTWEPGRFAQPAKPHVQRDGETVEFPDYRTATWPDGGLWSSARDLARVLQLVARGGELAGRRILQPASIERMVAPAAPVEPVEPAYGLLWETFGAYVGHAGSDPGVLTQMLVRRADGSGIVLLANVGFVDESPRAQVNSPWAVALGTMAQRLLEYTEACSP